MVAAAKSHMITEGRAPSIDKLHCQPTQRALNAAGY
jgi:hypothetical protein